MKWITREHPKIDRIACPWLIARFIDKSPEFLYVPADQVLRIAISRGLSTNFPDDHQMLKHGMVMYDALYAWCQSSPT
jgi:hypothetical protein